MNLRSIARIAAGGALLAVFSLTVASVLRSAEKSGAEGPPADLARALTGTWVHVGEPGKVGPAPAKGGFIKLRTADRWAAINIDSRSGLVTSTHGGRWSVKGGEYQESVEYGGEYHAFIMNKTHKWKVTVEGDTMTMVGLDNTWHEVWQRVK